MFLHLPAVQDPAKAVYDVALGPPYGLDDLLINLPASYSSSTRSTSDLGPGNAGASVMEPHGALFKKISDSTERRFQTRVFGASR